METLEIKPVTEKDYLFLYHLLSERSPIENISHKNMPTWREHVKFNKSSPYKEDYIIWNGNERVGRVYISRNDEVGIFITKAYRGFGYGTKILKQILKNGGTYLANIAPKNKRSQKFFEGLGFKLVQYTYKYESVH